MGFKNAEDVNTAAVVATGLIGGWLTARETGIRPIGGALLGAAGLYAGRSWLANGGPLVTAGLERTLHWRFWSIPPTGQENRCLAIRAHRHCADQRGGTSTL